MQEHDLRPHARGVRLTVCSWGPEDGPVVLLLHGFLEQGAAWDGVARELAGRGWRCVAPDHRGHGQSDHVGAGGFYHFWDYVADVDGVVRWLGGGPVHLVGHSMGGTMASLYAGTRPARIRSLTLVEGLGPPDTTASAPQRAVAFLDAREDPPRHPRLRDVQDAVGRMRRWNPTVPASVAERLAERVTRPVRPSDPLKPGDGPLTWTWDPMHRSRSPVPFQADLHRTILSRITAPTLLIDGATSPLRLADADTRIAALAHVTDHRVLDAGHHPHLDVPAALAASIHAHLENAS